MDIIFNVWSAWFFLLFFNYLFISAIMMPTIQAQNITTKNHRHRRSKTIPAIFGTSSNVQKQLQSVAKIVRSVARAQIHISGVSFRSMVSFGRTAYVLTTHIPYLRISILVWALPPQKWFSCDPWYNEFPRIWYNRYETDTLQTMICLPHLEL